MFNIAPKPSKSSKQGKSSGPDKNSGAKKTQLHEKLGKPTKTKQLHMTLRPKYSEHQVQHTTQDTKSNLLPMTLRPTEMSALPKGQKGV